MRPTSPLAGGVCAQRDSLEEVEANLESVRRRLSSEDMEELAEARAVMPAWIAEPVSSRIASG